MKKIKRILAFMLCVCMVAACWPTQTTMASTDTAVDKTLGGSTYYLNGVKTTIHYKDDFTSQAKYKAALGSYADSAYQFVWQEGSLTSQGDSWNNALFYGIQGYETMQNYTVSAEVSGTEGSGAATLVVYGSGDATDETETFGYEFAIYNGKFFRLGRRVNGKYTNLAGGTSGTDNLVKTHLSGYEVGDSIEMSLQVVTNAEGNVELTCKAALAGGEEKTILTYTDESDDKLTSGAPGLRNSKATGVTVNNITVTSQVEDSTYLYKDDFSYADSYIEALDGYEGTQELFVHQTDYLTASSRATYESKFSGIENSTSLSNYTVSADVSFVGTGFLCITAYGGVNTGYEFGIMSNGTDFRLYSRGGNTTDFGTSNTKKIASFFEESDGASTFKGESFTLSMDVYTYESYVSIKCYATYEGVTKQIYDMQDTSDKKYTAGVPGVRGTDYTSGDYVTKVDNYCVQTYDPTAETQYQSVEDYRKNVTTYGYPTETGKVFAGWYMDREFTKPLGTDVTEGVAFAKFVDEDVLSVKAQISADTTENSATTNMRFVTTVDCFDYQNVGFIVNGKKYGETTTVYETITAGEGGIAVSYAPADKFSNESIRFATVTLHSIPLYKDANENGMKDDGETDNINTPLTVTAYWTTADGTVVKGVTRTDITIQKGIDAINDQSTSQPYGLR